MVNISGGPPVDYTAYHYYCRYHNSAWQLPRGDNSVAAGAGLNQLNNQLDLIDTKLKAAETAGATPAPDCYTAVWRGNTTQSLASSSALSNPTFTWTNVFTLSGTPSIGSFNTTNGQFSITTAGYWRITYHMYGTGSQTFTEGYLSVVLKEASASAYPVRTLTTMPLETRAGATSVFKSVLYRCGTSGNIDLDTTKSYVLAPIQENNLAGTLTVGGSSTWISIEYVRPL